MRKIILILGILLGAGFLSLATVAGRVLRLASKLRNAAATDEKHSLAMGGLKRDYLLHVPDDMRPDKPAPLVVVFHGGGGHDWNMPGFTHFDDLADQEEFLVAYPDAVNGNWNDGRGISTADDVAFTRALIDDVTRSHPVDSRRVYATGISNGGFFSNRLACDLGGKIAAIASVAATMPKPLVAECRPARALSVMYIQGTEDPLVPINGGNIGFVRGRSRGQNISLAASAQFWRERDGISSAPEVKDLPDRFDDGTHVHRESWSGGADDTEVVVYTINGGGHTWPGGPQYLPKLVVGKASENLNATRVIWEFFQSNSLP